MVGVDGKHAEAVVSRNGVAQACDNDIVLNENYASCLIIDASVFGNISARIAPFVSPIHPLRRALPPVFNFLRLPHVLCAGNSIPQGNSVWVAL